jgi:cell division septal protein FtsQ
MARVALPESRIRTRRRRRRVLLAALVVFLLCLLSGGSVYFAQTPYLRIARIDISGAQTLSSTTVAALAAQELSGSYLGLFPRDNIFLYPKGAIARDIIAALPVVKEVRVGAKNFTAITVTVTERTPGSSYADDFYRVFASGSTLIACGEN